ncbi:MAG: ribosomal L7Ae/L30e/S12e/Gadd45 family protein [Clostridiales bacterium]|nr:ribosomal L7Ae/L30e/S12e/Gadd45 family protein [Clostridiales bacterium]
MKDKIFSLLGFAMKSGNVVTGESTCLIHVKKNSVYLVIVAKDASANTKKLFKNKTMFRNIPYRVYGTKSTLGDNIGKSDRATIAIKDIGFARKLIEYIDAVE